MGVEKVELDELLTRADFITLHTPLTEQTRTSSRPRRSRKTKTGVRIINCARGGLIDEAALAEALKSGQVAGAALDVFLEEPATNNPLFELPNVICTPHLGASTTEAQENVALQVAEQISAYLMTGEITNALNFPSISAEEAPRLTPWVQARRGARLVRRPAHRDVDQGHPHRVRGQCRRAQHQADDRGRAQWRAQAADAGDQHGLGAADRQGSRHQCRDHHPRPAGRL